MTIIDILVLLSLCYALYLGLNNGLFVSVASFLSLLIGLLGALKFSVVLKELLIEKFQWHSNYLTLICFVLTFILVILIVKVVAKLLTKMFKALYLGAFNRILGAVFEVLRISLIICILFAIFDKINANLMLFSEKELQTSYSYFVYQKITIDVFPDFFVIFNHLFDKSKEIISDQQNSRFF